MNVRALLADVMQRPLPPVEDATPLKDIAGWDSVMMVRLMLKLEERVGRELTEAEIESIASVGDVARFTGAVR